jgi:KRAB domain-containing zinc finger protein
MDTPGVLKCLHPGCKQLFENGPALLKHTKKVHEGENRFKCNECSDCFYSLNDLRVHKTIHFDKREFKCKEVGCSDSFKSSKDRLIHRDTMHRGDRFLCIYCEEVATDKILYEQHLKMHQTIMPGVFKCLHPECSETFSEPSDVKSHSKKHKTECDIPGCSFTGASMRDLQVHRKSVHSIWLHKCHLCYRGFDISGNLKRHLKSHETADHGVIKCVKVQRCKRTFTSLAKLKHHMEHHHKKTSPATKSKNSEDEDDCVYECQYCSKVFKSRLKMRAHSMRHETETPCVIKCVSKGCKETFSSVNFLKRHVVLHRKVV